MRWHLLSKDFIVPKLKFGLASTVATALDYGIYIGLTMGIALSETWSHAISYTLAMIVNFLMQKRFIFSLRRKVGHAFTLSIMFSLIGWMLSQALFNFLIYSFTFFEKYDLLAKVMVTATIFLYNFYTKRYSFENKPPWKK